MANGGAVAPARRGLAAHVGAARGRALLLLHLLRSFVTITAMNHRSQNETTGSTWLERAALVSEPHRDTVVELVLVPLFVEHRLEHAERSVLFRVRCRIRIREVCIAQCVLTVGSSPSPAARGSSPRPGDLRRRLLVHRPLRLIHPKLSSLGAQSGALGSRKISSLQRARTPRSRRPEL